MLRRTVLITISVCLTCIAANAQQFMQSVGFTAAVMNGNIITNTNVKFTPAMIGATYFPRVNFPLSPSASISAGLPLTLGIGIINNESIQINKKYLSFDLPLAIDYNDAFKASENGDESLGFFLGLGVGYSKIAIDSIPKSRQKATSVGIMVRGGIRIGLWHEDESEKDRGITIGIFHRTGLEELTRYKTTGISLLYDF